MWPQFSPKGKKSELFAFLLPNPPSSPRPGGEKNLFLTCVFSIFFSWKYACFCMAVRVKRVSRFSSFFGLSHACFLSGITSPLPNIIGREWRPLPPLFPPSVALFLFPLFFSHFSGLSFLPFPGSLSASSVPFSFLVETLSGGRKLDGIFLSRKGVLGRDRDPPLSDPYSLTTPSSV